jgi:F-type H+-transporting ATPase subunit b
MELDWTTFFLEILNFVILVWLLGRFLYQPVLDIIEQRRARIQQALDDAELTQAQTQSLKHQYENRLGDWEQEKAEAHQQLMLTLRAERQQALEQLQLALAQEQEKVRILNERQAQEANQAAERTSLTQGAAFSARLLSQLACPQLEERIVDLVLESLAQLPAEQVERLRQNGQAELIEITSAYPLDDGRQQRLSAALTRLLAGPCSPRFQQRPDLLAGLRIAIGPWRLDANLHDELKLFAEVGHGT